MFFVQIKDGFGKHLPNKPENTCQTNHKASWLLAQRLKFIIPTNLPPFTKISGEKDALHHRKQKCNN